MVENNDDKYSISWDPETLLPLLDPSLLTVNIALYRLNPETLKFLPFRNITRGHPNTGFFEFTLSNSGTLMEQHAYQVILRLSVGERLRTSLAGGSEGDSIFQTVFDNVIKAVKSFAESVSQWSSLDLVLYAFDRIAKQSECEEWHRNEPSNIGQMILDRVPACCETESKAEDHSDFVKDNNAKLVKYFHPDADSCYRQRTITRCVSYSS